VRDLGNCGHFSVHAFELHGEASWVSFVPLRIMETCCPGPCIRERPPGLRVHHIPHTSLHPQHRGKSTWPFLFRFDLNRASYTHPAILPSGIHGANTKSASFSLDERLTLTHHLPSRSSHSQYPSPKWQLSFIFHSLRSTESITNKLTT
jgi:hypothetical protein